MELRVEVREAENRVEGALGFDVHDLSVEGAFLRSDLLFEVGEEITVTFGTPDGHVVRARARIVRVSRGEDGERGPGMGIVFVGLTQEDREAVRALLARGG